MRRGRGREEEGTAFGAPAGGSRPYNGERDGFGPARQGFPRAVGYPLPLTSSLCPQKLTWRSNPSDINVCRMKGKQEVSGPWSRPQSAMTTLKLNRGHDQGEILLLLLHPRPATRVVMATP